MERIELGWFLVVVGAVIAVVGLILLLGPSFSWFGRLPGDIRIERDNFRFYFPVTTSILLSLLLTLVFSLLRFFGGPHSQ